MWQYCKNDQSYRKMILKKSTEEKMVDVQFDIHKFTSRTKPRNIEKIIIISCFSEFGCEVVGALYCVPRIISENPNCYIIVMGWHGREYLYRHLADEFWEIKEEYQFLRDYALAFHNSSKNLEKIEKAVKQYGRVISSQAVGKLVVGNQCNVCNYFWGQVEHVMACPQCNTRNINKALFADTRYWRKHITPIPAPSREKMLQARQYLGQHPVGVIARNRVTYGRNLPAEFYVKLVKLLQNMGFTPLWLGEKQTTLECPVEGIVDLTRKQEAKDLELTLAIVSQLKFTVQFWTASTRLSCLTGTPYIIFESPDQLFGIGQEAYRLSLCTKNNAAKIVLSNFIKISENHDLGIDLLKEAIEEMSQNNWSLKMGAVDEPESVLKLIKTNGHRLAI